MRRRNITQTGRMLHSCDAAQITPYSAQVVMRM
jgi:hypothetical protein